MSTYICELENVCFMMAIEYFQRLTECTSFDISSLKLQGIHDMNNDQAIDVGNVSGRQ